MSHSRTHYITEIRDNYIYESRHRKQYTLMAFLFDLLMIALTSGLWLIWIFCREMRKR